ncbi:hypothetical protein K505DRAFT_103844 [Melanomma pulvis-pyrius CBS 109.77]|uniref:Uncharacterized protein n=1 Tax=Melanomma pulvis-pyrius CBS 109.77 TaxID=1314802 RepID=A0A6A6WXV5_9PLEO|nr:hypothetical protein K505DRAFT_103844 [Melanomma pulvis-pyrius CBS 109.77]
MLTHPSRFNEDSVATSKILPEFASINRQIKLHTTRRNHLCLFYNFIVDSRHNSTPHFHLCSSSQLWHCHQTHLIACTWPAQLLLPPGEPTRLPSTNPIILSGLPSPYRRGSNPTPSSKSPMFPNSREKTTFLKDRQIYPSRRKRKSTETSQLGRKQGMVDSGPSSLACVAHDPDFQTHTACSQEVPRASLHLFQRPMAAPRPASPAVPNTGRGQLREQ